MKVVDLGEYSIVIADDDRNRRYNAVEDVFNFANKYNRRILIDKGDQLTFYYLESSNYLYSGGMLILYFNSRIPTSYKVGDEVCLALSAILNLD